MLFSIFQDIKNAELALFELNRVISLAPDHPEVFEQRAEVTPPYLRGKILQYFSYFVYFACSSCILAYCLKIYHGKVLMNFN